VAPAGRGPRGPSSGAGGLHRSWGDAPDPVSAPAQLHVRRGDGAVGDSPVLLVGLAHAASADLLRSPAARRREALLGSGLAVALVAMGQAAGRARVLRPRVRRTASTATRPQHDVMPQGRQGASQAPFHSEHVTRVGPPAGTGSGPHRTTGAQPAWWASAAMRAIRSGSLVGSPSSPADPARPLRWAPSPAQPLFQKGRAG
jgi:hypothetical protein